MEFLKIDSKDPKEHAQNIEKYITQLKEFCREEIAIVPDPKARALFETCADVLNGLEKALSDYQSENEGAWINNEDRPQMY